MVKEVGKLMINHEGEDYYIVFKIDHYFIRKDKLKKIV
jgi:hypothetical protein